MYYLYKWVSNCNNGKSHLKIFGYAINIGTAIATKIFDANCLNACDTPNYAITLPPGTIYYVPISGTPPVGARALYII